MAIVWKFESVVLGFSADWRGPIRRIVGFSTKDSEGFVGVGTNSTLVRFPRTWNSESVPVPALDKERPQEDFSLPVFYLLLSLLLLESIQIFVLDKIDLLYSSGSSTLVQHTHIVYRSAIQEATGSALVVVRCAITREWWRSSRYVCPSDIYLYQRYSGIGSIQDTIYTRSNSRVKIQSSTRRKKNDVHLQ